MGKIAVNLSFSKKKTVVRLIGRLEDGKIGEVSRSETIGYHSICTISLTGISCIFYDIIIFPLPIEFHK